MFQAEAAGDEWKREADGGMDQHRPASGGIRLVGQDLLLALLTRAHETQEAVATEAESV